MLTLPGRLLARFQHARGRCYSLMLLVRAYFIVHDYIMPLTTSVEGVQAQSISVFHVARERNLKIIPVLNKVPLCCKIPPSSFRIHLHPGFLD